MNTFSIATGQGIAQVIFLRVAAAVIFITGLMLFLFELFKIYIVRTGYFFDVAEWPEGILYICSIIFSTSMVYDCVCPTSWQWQFGAITVFLAWLGFLIYIRMLPHGEE